MRTASGPPSCTSKNVSYDGINNFMPPTETQLPGAPWTRPGSGQKKSIKSKPDRRRAARGRTPATAKDVSSSTNVGSAGTITLTLFGKPHGKGRPRITTWGGFARAYTPAKTRAYEANLAGVAVEAMAGRKPLYGPLIVKVTACLPVPASWPRKRRDAALAGAIRPTGRPDWDNLAKVCDALNGIVWKDDAQVVEGSVVKRYSESPKLVVEIRPLDPPLFSEESCLSTLSAMESEI